MIDPHSPTPSSPAPHYVPPQPPPAPQGQQPGQFPYAQPYGQQPGEPYGRQPQGQFGAPQPSKALAIISLVAGGLALLFSWLPVPAWILAVAAIVCGVTALIKKLGGKGLSIAGIVLGAVGAIIAVIIFVVALAVVAAYEQSSGKSLGELQSSVASARAAANAEHTIQYKVTTTGPASVSYSDADGSSSEDITTAWTKEFKDTGYAFGSVSVSGTERATQVTCEILIDGKSVSQNSASGPYNSARCSGNVK